MGNFAQDKNNFTSINREISYFIKNKQYSKALALIEENLSIKYDPYLMVFKAHIILVTSNGDEEKFNEAEKILNNVLDEPYITFPTRKYALTELARLASMRNDQVSSLDFYKKILNESKLIEPTVRCKMASIYGELGMYSHALEILNVPDFNNEAMNNSRCHIYIQQKMFKAALDALDKPVVISGYTKDASDMNPIRVEREKYYFLGCIYHSYYGDFNQAIKCFQNAIKDSNKFDTIYWPCITGLISVYFSDLQYDKCVELCNLFLSNVSNNHKNYPRVVKTLIRVYIEKKDYYKALKLAKKYNAKDLEIFVLACIKIYDFDFISAYELLDKIETNDEGLEVEIMFRKIVALFRLKRVDEFNYLYDDFVVTSSRSKYMNSEVKSMKACLVNNNCMFKNNLIDNYYGNQIINYSEESFRSYLKDHFAKKFNSEINLDELVDYIKKQIEVMSPKCAGFYDLYIISYRGIGVTKDGKPIHNLIVKCLPDTKNIVLMLPSDYEKDEYEKIEITSKQKRMSQIDKFNKRYGNN